MTAPTSAARDASAKLATVALNTPVSVTDTFDARHLDQVIGRRARARRPAHARERPVADLVARAGRAASVIEEPDRPARAQRARRRTQREVAARTAAACRTRRSSVSDATRSGCSCRLRAGLPERDRAVRDRDRDPGHRQRQQRPRHRRRAALDRDTRLLLRDDREGRDRRAGTRRSASPTRSVPVTSTRSSAKRARASSARSRPRTSSPLILVARAGRAAVIEEPRPSRSALNGPASNSTRKSLPAAAVLAGRAARRQRRDRQAVRARSPGSRA